MYNIPYPPPALWIWYGIISSLFGKLFKRGGKKGRKTGEKEVKKGKGIQKDEKD